MPKKTKPWNLKHIAQKLENEFNACKTMREQVQWRKHAKKQCKKVLDGRKPTPGEQSILDAFGIKL